MAVYLSDADTVDGVSAATSALWRLVLRGWAWHCTRRADQIERRYGGTYLGDMRRLVASPVTKMPRAIKEPI